MNYYKTVLHLAFYGTLCASQPDKDRAIDLTAQQKQIVQPTAIDPQPIDILHSLTDLTQLPIVANWEVAAQKLIELVDQATTQDELEHLEEQFIQLLPESEYPGDREMDLLRDFHEAKVHQEDILQETVAPITKKVMVRETTSSLPYILPPQAHIFNHIYGQHDIANATDGHRYNTACAAIATAAVTILGSRLGKTTGIDALTETYQAELMQNILSAGATAYDETPDKDAANFVLSEDVVPILMSQQQNLNFRVNEELTLAYADRIHALAESTSYTPDLPFRTLLDLIQQNTTRSDEIIATGVVLSDGNKSNAVLYIRGDQLENARFILYDSHQRSHLMPPSGLLTETQKTSGSFLAWAPDINTIISIARADGRWPTTIASTSSYTNLGSLQSPFFIDILRPQPIQT